MSDLAGLGTLAWFNLRRDRIVLAVSIIAIVAVATLIVSSVDGLYPTRAKLEANAALITENPGVSALHGAPRGLESLGGLAAYEVGVYLSVAVAVIGVLLVGRHCRGDEEAGRTELVLATATGRRAPLTAALLIVAAADLLVAAGLAAGLAASGLALSGSLLLGAWVGAVGLAFAGVAALTAQLSESRRAATGMALAVLVLSYGLRAAGDASNSALSWLSPIGWAQQSRPFGDERWWPILLLLGATGVLVAVAYGLLARRDLGAGLLPPRPGPAVAELRLLRRFGLALRLQRASLVAWSAGLFLLGLVYGTIVNDVGSLLEDNEPLRDILAQVGGPSLADSFIASTLLMLALIGSGFTLQSALRARGEETAGRAELLLAGPVGRSRWAGGHFGVALAGTVVVLAAAGAGEGLGAAITTGDAAELPRIAGAALVQVPAVWVLAGLAIAAYGLAPRAVAVAWVALAVCFVVGLFGALLDLPAWLIDLSPYSHVPEVPASALTPGPLIALTAIAAALLLVGVAGLRRRDID